MNYRFKIQNPENRLFLTEFTLMKFIQNSGFSK